MLSVELIGDLMRFIETLHSFVLGVLATFIATKTENETEVQFHFLLLL